MTLGSTGRQDQPLPALRDLDQPFAFNMRLYNRPYRFEFYDTASPTNYTLLKPSVIILCYNIGDPDSLLSVRKKWKLAVETHFNYDESLPVIVLGLQRDVRSKRSDYDGKIDDRRTFVYPQEALRAAQEMRCDRYCECSALTGEVRSF